MRIDDEPSGGLRLTPPDVRVWMLLLPVALVLLAITRLPSDRALAFAASSTLTGAIMLALAARTGVTARTAELVLRIRRRAFVGTVAVDGGGAYREAARRALVLVDGAELAGPVRVEVRRDRESRGPVSYKIYLVGERQLVIVDGLADGAAARVLAHRLERALGHEPSPLDVEREFAISEDSPATMWLLLTVVAGYMGLAVALSHWLFSRPALLTEREPIAPLVLVSFGAASYWAWSTVGAAAARARVVAEFGLRR
ncbi:MAG: hypothetical protein JWM53_6767 [bacterium]|nr:hypothetical protein [bacterium]